MGKIQSVLVLSLNLKFFEIAKASAIILPWVKTTPLGLPVVPEV